MKPQTPRTPSQLSDSVHRQLSMYALAASAAGVGVLALAQPAEAKIVYTKTHHVIEPNSSFALDLNHGGKADFTLFQLLRCTTRYCVSALRQMPAVGNGVIGGPSSVLTWVNADLRSGSSIGPQKANFLEKPAYLVAVADDFTESVNSFGPWRNVKNRYLGLKFRIGGKAHYGWARMTVESGYSEHYIKATLTGYAYETVPNKAIIAGKTKGPDVITVQPASLGHLAQGSAGLAAWRTGK